MKKILAYFLVICILSTSVIACRSKQEDEAKAAGDRIEKKRDEKNKAARELGDDTPETPPEQ